MAFPHRLPPCAAALLLFAVRLGCAEEATACIESGGVSTCSNGAHGNGARSPASLLQKTFGSVERHGFAQEDDVVANCTGVVAQGTCWYLSNMSESCGATCARNGHNFSYVAADTSAHVMSKLVGHDPVTKQHAWVAFECYVPDEDRYHLANANVAKHSEDLSSWSHESCRLACPCGNASSKDVSPTDAPMPPSYAPMPPSDAPKTGCQWRPVSSCVKEFDYEGVHYMGCTAVDHDIPWCSNTHPYSGSWSNCVYTCANSAPPSSNSAPPSDTPLPPSNAPVTGCQWRPVSSCVKEFDYEGTHYMGCTAVDHDIPWCSNTHPYGGSWSNCVYSCASTPENAPGSPQCTWNKRPACAKSFLYKGVNHTGCSDIDHPTPWCSYDRVHKGNWTECERVCTTVPPTVQPTASPTNAGYYGAPCDRHPEHENDAIGNLATLDETGYKIAVATDSAINMKRFVCRVVEKIACRVNDYPSLMALVPRYLGSVVHETYEHLESELTTLCHTIGKWVVPLGHP